MSARQIHLIEQIEWHEVAPLEVLRHHAGTARLTADWRAATWRIWSGYYHGDKFFSRIPAEYLIRDLNKQLDELRAKKKVIDDQVKVVLRELQKLETEKFHLRSNSQLAASRDLSGGRPGGAVRSRVEKSAHLQRRLSQIERRTADSAACSRHRRSRSVATTCSLTISSVSYILLRSPGVNIIDAAMNILSLEKEHIIVSQMEAQRAALWEMKAHMSEKKAEEVVLQQRADKERATRGKLLEALAMSKIALGS
eukprot:gene30890-38177_t